MAERRKTMPNTRVGAHRFGRPLGVTASVASRGCLREERGERNQLRRLRGEAAAGSIAAADAAAFRAAIESDNGAGSGACDGDARTASGESHAERDARMRARVMEEAGLASAARRGLATALGLANAPGLARAASASEATVEYSRE